MKKFFSMCAMAAVSLVLLTGCGEKAPELEWENGKQIALWDDTSKIPYYDEKDDQPISNITPYVVEGEQDGRCVVIFPGGGYQKHADMETEQEIVEALHEHQISAFVVDYRIAPYTKDAIMSDGMRAVRFVRYYAEAFGVNPEKISVMGLSAGGHLALMTMERFEDELDVAGDAIDQVSARPDSGILCYPVVSFLDDYTHKTSRKNFLGEENAENEALQKEYSGEFGVKESTPPMFLWHTRRDQGVPYEGTERLAQAMDAQGIPCELHLYEYGAHGSGLAKGIPDTETWFDSCMEWLDQVYETE